MNKFEWRSRRHAHYVGAWACKGWQRLEASTDALRFVGWVSLTSFHGEAQRWGDKLWNLHHAAVSVPSSTRGSTLRGKLQY